MICDPGLFISFEGIDGAGKSTHIAALAQEFRRQGRAVTLTREPGGSPLAEKLRHLVLQEPMDVETETLLVFAARRDHLKTVIEPALARGEVVLCDRFTDSTFAYQGGGRGLDGQILRVLEQWVQTVRPPQTEQKVQEADSENATLVFRQPELTVWFDVSPAVAAQRLSQVRSPDKFEVQTQLFFDRVVAAYAQRMQAHPQRFVRIQADNPPPLVWQEVLRAFQSKGWLI